MELHPSIKEKKISVLIPAKNEKGNIELLLNRLDATFRQHRLNGDVVIVNDGSTDGTDIILNEKEQEYGFLKVMHHKTGLGLSAAMMTGFPECRGDIVLFLPADLESDPVEDIPVLLNGFIDGAEVVLGWRVGRKDGKSLVSAIYNTISGRLFKVRFHDMNWIKAFTREAVEELNLRKDWHRFIVHILQTKGFKIKEVPTNWHERRYGTSKFDWRRIPTSFVDIFVVWLSLNFSHNPMRVFAPIGYLLLLLGFGMGCALAATYFLYETQYRPLFTVALILILAGIQLLLSGFIAEMLVELKEEVRKIKRKIDTGSK